MAADGGIRAISGFLYQVLAGGALRASGYCKDILTSGIKELDALFELAAIGDVVHEVADEDLVIRTALVDPASGHKHPAITLVQAKFSVDGTGKSIGPQELKGIIDAFSIASKRLKAGGSNVVGYVLVTNRVVTGSRIKPKGKLKEAIYSQLKTITDAKVSIWHTAFERFARKFGLLEKEIIEGRQKLLGKIFENAASGFAHGEISREDLLQCLAGGTNAKHLDATTRAEQIADEVRDFDADVHPVAIRREKLFDINRLCAGRALIVFTGPGGMGKTSAIHQWAVELAARNKMTKPGSSVAIRSAFGLPEEWLCELVHNWNPGLRPTDRQNAVDRLAVANEGAVPVLHLALDGVDETRGEAGISTQLRRLLLWFADFDRKTQMGETVRARLVVTCRDGDEFARECLFLGRSGGPLDPKKKPMEVHFDRFSENELRQLLQENFPQYIPVLLPPVPSLDGAEGGGSATTSGTLTQLSEVLLDPVMWRGFCEMDSSERDQLVKGIEAAELILAAKFCARFLQKAKERTGIPIDLLGAALKLIAKGSKDRGAHFRSQKDWSDPAVSAGLALVQAQRLQVEAASGGLISKQPDCQWDWRTFAIERFFVAG